MKNVFLLITCIVFFLTLSSIAQDKGNFSSIELLSIPAYKNYKGSEARLTRLVFHGGQCFGNIKAYIKWGNEKDSLIIDAKKDGYESLEIPLPGRPSDIDVQAEVEIWVDNKKFIARCIVTPARKWTLFILPHSHVDIGYTNIQSKVLKLHMDNIDESISLAEKTKDYPAGSRYKWNTEAVWVVENYLKQADAEKRQKFWNAVKSGWIGIDAGYGNINTSATDSRQLLQMFYEGRKLCKENGIEINTLFQGDVPGSSMGLPAQSALTGVRYFLSGPNASDRIGYLARWQDKPFYWLSASGKDRILFWQCQPYSIGYKIKGSKIPNFFTIEDPKPFYTGEPSRYFLNPEIFGYLDDLQKVGFPYDMTIATWALSDNAPIDPELPDAVKQWNETFTSPKLVICTTNDFFQAFEKKYENQLPVLKGDYTEYWTDGLGSAAKETSVNRQASIKLQQADAVMAMRNIKNYPSTAVNETWKNLLLFSEHTWGAHNSVSEPGDPKVKSQWAYKQAFALQAGKKADSLLSVALGQNADHNNVVQVYNTNSWARTDLVLVPAALSATGDIVKSVDGKTILSQRLKTGELAFVADNVPAFGVRRYFIKAGRAVTATKTINTGTSITNGIYKIVMDSVSGNIVRLEKNNLSQNLIDSVFNKYVYLPGDSIEKMQTTAPGHIIAVEQGPLVNSIQYLSEAPGAVSLKREIRLIKGIDRIEIINTIDKRPVLEKESVLFKFPFFIPGAQVRYAIPWGSVQMEADQLPFANRNWYTIQNWLDISNQDYGVTFSSPDCPLVTIGDINIGGLLGGLRNSPLWKKFSEQSPIFYSWVMNNLWHTNFPASQEGELTIHYYFKIHGPYDELSTIKTGFENSWPLLAGPGSDTIISPPLIITGNNLYAEGIKPAMDQNGMIVYIVNAGKTESKVNITIPHSTNSPKIWQTNILEQKEVELKNGFSIPGKGVLMVRVEE